MNSSFNNETLAEKLSKLNNSQQSIESLSSWCITHRKKAKQIVETWEKFFNSSSDEKKVSSLYLANDILQNSRRKGSEFVNEFWKVLPGALKNVHDSGGDHGKKVVLRLVGIWDERKVFGSRGRGLKDDIFGQEPPHSLDNNENSSNPIKLVRKDAQTIRFKLPVGGMPAKIVTAYQYVLDEHLNEDAVLNKCKTAFHLVGKMEKEFDDACSHGNLHGLPSLKELQEQEATLKQCVDQLGGIEATRAALVVQLKEALEDQVHFGYMLCNESKLELICSQIQVAQTESEHASNLRQRLMSATSTTNNSIPSPNLSNPTITTTLPVETTHFTELNPPLQTSNVPPFQPPQPVTSFTNSSTSAEEQQKKAAAAAMAEKLAASTSSAQMLTSVLSSLISEGAASKNGSLSAGTITSSPPMFPAEKRPKLEKPVPSADLGNTYFAHLQQQIGSMPLPLPQISVSGMQAPPHTNQAAPPFPPPPPPPLPPVPPPHMQQFVQTSGGMVGVGPYGFTGNPLPPPPPLPPSVSMGLARPSAPTPQQPPLPPMPPPQQQQQQQQQTSAGFYQPPGIGFYGQTQAAPPVPRQ
ncbi:regulation of nuclear pre-mRNA domain-containing protein 1B-like [Iris pallida]|uniref:Regulation of nuclear pre-mRNA domain-containing protein 1B-like n=1 Tax=Iris pallida TaxID=29817 RepID=A0AAX6DFQ1_IRIPA|nr:regulation of nuclear pre-mRNA domain-containing protein 1B-like [Iris pallida]